MKFIGTTRFEDGELALWETLQESFGSQNIDDELDVAYHGLPILKRMGCGDREPDVAILHRTLGLLVIEVKDARINQIDDIDGPRWEMNESWTNSSGGNGRKSEEEPFNQSRNQMFELQNLMKSHNYGILWDDDLDRCKVFCNHLVALPFIDKRDFEERFPQFQETHRILFKGDMNVEAMKLLPTRFKRVHSSSIPEDIFIEAKVAIGGSPVVPKRISRTPKNKSGKMAFLRDARMKMQPLLSYQQQIAGQTVPDGPQRIRGLAGSGKTIVMAMKILHVYQERPDWKILVTYGTIALYTTLGGRVRNLIQEQDLDALIEETTAKDFGCADRRLLFLHAHKVFSLCHELFGVSPKWGMSFKQTLDVNSNNIILKINQLIEAGQYEPPFDCVIADESQDLGDPFMRLCLSLAKEKRFIWGVDEMQQLGDIEVRSPREIFGEDEDGLPLVDLSGEYPGEIPKDILLNIVYRTPRPVLFSAHLFGLGLLRKDGAVQCLESVQQWNDVGYEVFGASDEKLTPGEAVSISRDWKMSPHNLENVIGYEGVCTFKNFDSEEEEISWVANQVKHLVEIDCVPPEEILVLHMNNNKVKYYLSAARSALEDIGISVFYYEDEKNVFSRTGAVTLQTLRRAKGHEAGFVFVMGMDHAEGPHNNYKLTQLRNTAFMAMTRTNGYLTVTASGSRGSLVVDELSQLNSSVGRIGFEVPNYSDLRRIYAEDMSQEMTRRRRKRELESLLKGKDGDNLSDDILSKIEQLIKGEFDDDDID